MDAKKIVEEYISEVDWRVSENANATKSLSGLMFHTSNKIIGKYTLENVYPTNIREAHQKGYIHIHDLGMGIAGYCAGWSLKKIIVEGFNGIVGKTDSKPPKHLSSITWQMINFIGTLQNEWAGAQAFSSVDTYLAPFIRTDKLTYEEVKQIIQGFIFNMNVPSRWGGQTPFSNVTFDWVCPEDIRKEPAIVGGKEQSFTYGECQEVMNMINKAFLEVYMEGDANGRVFTFPIPTYNITKDFIWDNENAKLLFKMTSKYGIPYFQNFINSDLNPSDIRSMCCRLQLDLTELRKRGNGLFGSGEQTGSLGVVTLNLSKLAYESKIEAEKKEKNKEEIFLVKVKKFAILAKDSLEIKRKIVTENLDKGLMPYTKRYLGSIKNHFNTIGVIGGNEACLNLINKDIGTKEGKELILKVLNHIRELIVEFQEETKNLYNLEASPGEGTTYRLARIDKKQYPDIKQSGTEETPYYTNSTQLPVGHTEDIIEAIIHQEELQGKYTGGTVLHMFVGERISDWINCMTLVRKIANKTKIPYFTITPTFSICPVHGYISGEHKYCPLDHTVEEKQQYGIYTGGTK